MFVRTMELEGFMPFRDRHRLNFEKDKIYGVQGQYNSDPAESNRAGKSSFIDAQVWCLFGESRAKKDVELVHTGAEFAEVTCELYDHVSDRSLWVTRVRTADNKGYIELLGAEGEKKRLSQEELNKFIGMTYDEFLFTAFFKQDDIDQFMKADPQEKKEILLGWIKEIDWAIYCARASEIKLEFKAEKERLQSILDEMPTEELDEAAIIAETQEKQAEKVKLQADYEANGTRMNEINVQVNELKTVNQKKVEAQNLANRIQQLKNRRPDSTKMTAALTQLNGYLAKYAIITPEQAQEAQLKRDNYISTIATANADIRRIEGELSSASQTLTGTCPLLNSPCSRIEPDPEVTAAKEKAINGLKAKVVRYQEFQTKSNQYLALYQKQIEWKQQKEKIELQVKAVNELESQIADMTNQHRELLKRIPQDADARMQELRAEMTAISEDNTAIKNLITEIDQWVGQASEQIKNNRAAKERKQATEMQLEVVTQQFADAQYVEYMFGTNGIPSMELENSFQEIEDNANLILKKLKAPFYMQFDATRELGTWEPNCLACGEVFEKNERTHRCKACDTPREKKKRDEVSVTIFEQGQEKKFYMDSGGGKMLMSVAIRLALTLLARSRKGSRWGTIYLDELFGKLDSKNRKLMGDLITSALMNELGFEQIFIISHDPTIQSSMAEQIIINRDAGSQVSEILM